MQASFPLPADCEDLARRVEASLDGFLRERRALAVEQDPGVAPAFDELERVIAAGGKRLRPIFCCLGHRAAGAKDSDEIVRAASALELLHTFALVHDDVMDRSEVRRAAPTTWLHLTEEHRRDGLAGDAERFGISGAVLVGDLALALADQAFLAAGFAPERLLEGIEAYHRMRTDMVAGQFLDVEAARRPGVSEPLARRIAVLKSGVYTVQGPLHIGALLGGAGEDLLRALSVYGVALGEAFQLRDDVLGIFGDPSVTGKDRDSDLLEGKRTVLVAKATAAAPARDREFLEAHLGRADLSPRDLERLRAIIRDSGALDGTLALIEDLSRWAREALGDPALPPDVARVLSEMADTLVARPA